MTSKILAKKIVQKFVSCAQNNIQSVMNKASMMLWDDGKCQVVVKLEPEHISNEGRLHSGVAVVLTDVTSGLALFSHPNVRNKVSYPLHPSVIPSTVNLHISYVNTTPPDDEILIEANVRTSNGPIAFINVSILDRANRTALVEGNFVMYNKALIE